MKRVVAIVIFYDKGLNIFLQDRRTHSKLGEKYGFWGGGIEKGETPEEAVKRELLEELNYVPKDISYWGQYSFTFMPTNEIYYGEMFLSPITDELVNSKIAEGSGSAVVPFDEIIKNKNNELGSVTTDCLKLIKKDLQKLVAKI